MLINLRNALMTGKRKPTAKDYIQNGLIALIDGIENAGWGMHSTTNLCDLITGYSFTLPSGGTAGSDYIKIATTAGVQITNATPTEDLSIEYVVSFDDNNTARECALEEIRHNNSFRFKKISGYLQASFVGTYVQLPFEVGTPATMSAAYGASESPKLCGYKNGEFVRGINFAHTMAGRYGGGFTIGRTGYTAYENVYCVRVYNRALTSEEIATNYAIDKARFHLP